MIRSPDIKFVVISTDTRYFLIPDLTNYFNYGLIISLELLNHGKRQKLISAGHIPRVESTIIDEWSWQSDYFSQIKYQLN